VTFWALGEIVKSQAGILESDEPAQAAAKLEAAVAVLLADASEAFAQLLADRELLAGGRLSATTEIPVPETVEGLIAARLDTLAPERKALLQDAAVVGRVFWSGALAAVGGVDAAEVRPGLQVLERKQLVRQARASSVAHQDEYGFWHALVRDVCYAQIPRAGRARRHRAAAEWLEEVAGDRVADLAEILAHHYRQALTYARAAGDDQAQADRLEGPARRALVLAGDRAVNLDVDRARTYYQQAIDLCPPDHPERPRLLVKIGWVAFQSGKLAEAADAYEEAIAGLRSRRDVHGLGVALDRLATVRWNQGDTRGPGRRWWRASSCWSESRRARSCARSTPRWRWTG
jgi:predicted ATPase